MSVLLIEAQYHPPAVFFAELLGAAALQLDAHEHYRKQTYRNRCLILTAQGVLPLTVPVLDGSRSAKVKTAEIEIDYRQNWVYRHWRTLQTAYGGTPYFEFYADYLHDIYVRKLPRLLDLNTAFLRFYLRCLRLPVPVELTTEYLPPTVPHSLSPSFAHSPLLLDRRDWLTPKAPPMTPGPDRKSVREYPQTFGKDFVPGLSILDLLFMQGPAAGAFLT